MAATGEARERGTCLLRRRRATQLDSDIAGRAVPIGRASGDHVVSRVRGRMHGSVDDYWDGNWLISEVAVAAGDLDLSYLSAIIKGLAQLEHEFPVGGTP